ncbi:MAG: hypothetical protein B6I19_03295 [Bacteroidetes bacterium 4572_114]|nr:MAG: hypothetical protein B6I19_03295 [Bacteroidetes bacterium 4572_114]
MMIFFDLAKIINKKCRPLLLNCISVKILDKMKKIIFISLLVSFYFSSLAQSTTVLFTLEDRDRIIRTEQGINLLRNEMNTRFESMNVKFESQQQQINDLKTMFVWGFGVLISLMLFTLGYTIWDRRTALNPV